MTTEDYSIPLDEALQLLDVIPDYDPGDGPKPCVHTFLNGAWGLVGAHWSVENLTALMQEHGVLLSGEMATRRGHGLVVVRPEPQAPLFIATKESIAP